MWLLVIIWALPGHPRSTEGRPYSTEFACMKAAALVMKGHGILGENPAVDAAYCAETKR